MLVLTDAYRIEQLGREESVVPEALRDVLLASALVGLEHYAELGEHRRPAHQRLAFRELGLAIGLRAVALMRQAQRRSSADDRCRQLLDAIGSHVDLADEIVAFWRERESEHPRVRTWTEHLDINEVMLATCLVPKGVLGLRALG